jgi:hypothetical protein
LPRVEPLAGEPLHEFLGVTALGKTINIEPLVPVKDGMYTRTDIMLTAPPDPEPIPLPPAPEPSGKWEPSGGDILDLLLGIAAVIMYLRPPNWELGLPLALFLILPVLFTAHRRRSPFYAKWTVALVAIAIFVWAIWPPLWSSFGGRDGSR